MKLMNSLKMKTEKNLKRLKRTNFDDSSNIKIKHVEHINEKNHVRYIATSMVKCFRVILSSFGSKNMKNPRYYIIIDSFNLSLS